MQNNCICIIVKPLYEYFIVLHDYMTKSALFLFWEYSASDFVTITAVDIS